jgi:hypothetical protein
MVYYAFFFLLGARVGTQSLYMLGKHFTTELHPQPFFFVDVWFFEGWSYCISHDNLELAM